MAEIRNCFQRYEKKFLLTQDQYKAMKEGMAAHMQPDEHSCYTICNLYYDTEDWQLIRESLEKPLYKEKLRLRTHGVPKSTDHQAFVEIKKKYKGVVYKRRIPLKLKEAEDYLYNGIRPKKESQILKEIDWFLKVHAPIKPKVVLTYVRRAFYGAENPDFRMTIDRDITCRYDDLHLTSGVHGDKLLKDGQSLLEIKIPGVMPLWMSKILSDLKIYPASYSKYGTYYSTTPELYMTASKNGHKAVK